MLLRKSFFFVIHLYLTEGIVWLSINPTRLLKILELQNSRIESSELGKMCRLADFEALQLGIVWSGS